MHLVVCTSLLVGWLYRTYGTVGYYDGCHSPDYFRTVVLIYLVRWCQPSLGRPFGGSSWDCAAFIFRSRRTIWVFPPLLVRIVDKRCYIIEFDNDVYRWLGGLFARGLRLKAEKRRTYVSAFFCFQTARGVFRSLVSVLWFVRQDVTHVERRSLWLHRSWF